MQWAETVLPRNYSIQCETIGKNTVLNHILNFHSSIVADSAKIGVALISDELLW